MTLKRQLKGEMKHGFLGEATGSLPPFYAVRLGWRRLSATYQFRSALLALTGGWFGTL
jgi:hypothetical protein